MTSSRAIVIGAGLGGLSAAIRLRLSGWDVLVLERMPTPGGRCNRFESKGYRFDTGPTLLMMLSPLREIFEAAGRKIEDYLDLVRLNPHSRVHFADGNSIDLDSRVDATAKSLERLESGSGDGLQQWMRETEPLFQVGMSDFVERNSPRLSGLLEPQKLGFFFKGQVLGPLYASLSTYFQDQRIQDALAFSALYLGMNPFKAPSIYSLIPFAELNDGLFFPRSGMHEIPLALKKLAEELGIEFRFRTEVEGLNQTRHRVESVVCASGEVIEARAVVVNADLPRAYKQLLGESHCRDDSLKYSCGTFLLHLGVSRSFARMLHHQMWIPESFEKTVTEIFDLGKIPEYPAFYLCCPSQTDKSLAPRGCSSMMALVPVPNVKSEIDWTVETDLLRNHILDRLELHGFEGISSNIEVERIMTPEDMSDEWNLEQGAAFGLCHRLSQMGPLRPRNKHHKLKNLYFTGASTHPGNGIPMVIISGKLVAQRVVEEQPIS